MMIKIFDNTFFDNIYFNNYIALEDSLVITCDFIITFVLSTFVEMIIFCSPIIAYLSTTSQKGKIVIVYDTI